MNTVLSSYLKTSFIQKGGTVERILLINENNYDDDTAYKNIVDTIRSTYFSSLPTNYSVEYRDLSSAIKSNGYDFALFYNEQNHIIAIQVSTYDDKHEQLLRIYFARDLQTQNQYLRKYHEIRTKKIIPFFPTTI